MMSRAEFFSHVRRRVPDYSTVELYAAFEAYLCCPQSPFREASAGIECGRCGRCCRRPWRVEAQLQDVLRWINERRWDILAGLVHDPIRSRAECEADPVLVQQTAGLLAGLDPDMVLRILGIVGAIAAGYGGYTMPRSPGCHHLIDGAISVCGIYDTRPEVCRRFPEIRRSP